MSLAELTPSNKPTPLWIRALLGLALAGGLLFIAGFAVKYLSWSPEAYGIYWPKRVWLLLHIGGGAVALMLGPFVLGLGLQRRRMQLHRKLGLGYTGGIAVGSFAAFYLAFNTDIHWAFGMGLTGLALAWILTTGLAFASIRRRMITQHKEWMIRSYVVTFAFVNFRVLVGVLEASGIGTEVDRLNAASWFCWAVPLLITEVILQGRKIFAQNPVP